MNNRLDMRCRDGTSWASVFVMGGDRPVKTSPAVKMVIVGGDDNMNVECEQ